MNTRIVLSGTPLEHESEWIEVPAGDFIMGSGNNDHMAFNDETPQHTTTIYTPYLIARTPTTNDQYKAFVQDTGHRGPRHWRRGGDVPDHPVTSVDWNDALAYCKWLTQEMQKAGRFLEGTNLRVTLPNEPQWARAARMTHRYGVYVVQYEVGTIPKSGMK